MAFMTSCLLQKYGLHSERKQFGVWCEGGGVFLPVKVYPFA